MFYTMIMYHKKFTSLNNLTPRTENKEKLKQEVLINAGNIYNELYYIYKNKYNKKINRYQKNRIKLDYKKLRLADDYEYPSEKEEKQKEKQEEKQEETKDDAIALKKGLLMKKKT